MASPTLATSGFERRHIGPSPDEVDKMLAALGYDSLEALITALIPSGISDTRLRLPAPVGESDVL